MAESRVFESNGIRMEEIVQQVEHFLREEKKMDVQTAYTQGGCLLQASQGDTLRMLSGMKLATTVQFSVSGSALNVTIGEGQWADKLGAGAVGLFLLWPLAITSGIGAYKQKKLPAEIFEVIGHLTFGAQGGFSPAAEPAASATAGAQQYCPQCHAPLPQGAIFCSTCGTKLLTNCPHCGEAVAPGSKFCPKCGQSL